MWRWQGRTSSATTSLTCVDLCRSGRHDRDVTGRRANGQCAECARKQMRERNARQRARAIAILGGACAWCDTADDLQIDHITPCRALGEREHAHALWRRVVRGETENLQLLCCDCHRGKTNREKREEYTKLHPFLDA